MDTPLLEGYLPFYVQGSAQIISLKFPSSGGSLALLIALKSSNFTFSALNKPPWFT